MNVLVHELTHCALSRGHRFFDEGLAVYLEKKINNSIVSLDLNTANGSLRHLINNNNTSPDFREIKNIDQETIYEIAALTTSWMIDKNGVESLKQFLSSLYACDAENPASMIFEAEYEISIDDLQLKLFDDDIEHTLEIESQENQKIIGLYKKISCQLIFEEAGEIEAILSELNNEPENEFRQLTLLKGDILSVLSSKSYEDDLVTKWKRKALYYISESEYTIDSFLFRLYINLLDIKHNRNFMKAAREMRNVMEEAFNYFPDSCELKVAGQTTSFETSQSP